jgi:hypothetical protein
VPWYFFCGFLRFFGLVLEKGCAVFLGSPCNATAKNAIKNKSKGKDDRKKVFPPSTFLAKSF